MTKPRFTESQIVGVLKEVELGAKVNETCRKHGIIQVQEPVLMDDGLAPVSAMPDAAALDPTWQKATACAHQKPKVAALTRPLPRYQTVASFVLTQLKPSQVLNLEKRT